MDARIRVTVDTPRGKRTLHRAVGSVSSFGGSPLRQKIGLGAADSIERVEIDWPGSGNTQVLREVPLNAMIRVTKGSAGFELIRFDAHTHALKTPLVASTAIRCLGQTS
ncbi:MAG: ASPIC/UnbV domain-containing protein [Pirellulales bacterium]|nr:ASPIC/UnbV domain-containing protein [Pirellulales bacterium]